MNFYKILPFLLILNFSTTYTFAQFEFEAFSGELIELDDFSTGNPYPMEIEVSSMPSKLTYLRIYFEGVSHTNMEDIDMVLEAPDGQLITIFSDVPNYSGNPSGYGELIFDFDSLIPFDEENYREQDDVYMPRNIGMDDEMPQLGLVSNLPSFASLEGIDPNGTWKLYVYDDTLNELDGRIGGPDLFIEATDMEVCNWPGADLNIEGFVDNNAEVSITDLDGATWDLVYERTFEEFATINLDYNSTPTIENIDQSNYTIADLEFATRYVAYFRIDCSEDNTRVSRWKGPYYFELPSGECAGFNTIDVCQAEEYGNDKYNSLSDPCQPGNSSSHQMYSFTPTRSGDYYLSNLSSSTNTIRSISYRIDAFNSPDCDQLNWLCADIDDLSDYLLENLQQDSIYKILIFSNSNFEFTISDCPLPRNIELENAFEKATDVALNFTQNENPLVGVFDIFYTDDQSFDPDLNTTPSMSAFNFSDGAWTAGLGSLTPETSYKLYLRSNCSSGVSCWGAPVFFETVKDCGTINENEIGVKVSSMTAWINHNVSSFNNLFIIIDDEPFSNPPCIAEATVELVTNGRDNEQGYPGVFLYGLNPNTEYHYYLKTHCQESPIESQAWQGPFVFSTDDTPPFTAKELYCNQCITVDTEDDQDPMFPDFFNGELDIFPNPNPNACTFDSFDPLVETLFRYEADLTGTVTLKKNLGGFCSSGNTEFLASFYIKSASQGFDLNGWEYLGCSYQISSSSSQNIHDQIDLQVEKDSVYYLMVDIQGESCNNMAPSSRYEIEGDCVNPCNPAQNLTATPGEPGHQVLNWDEVPNSIGFEYAVVRTSSLETQSICVPLFFNLEQGKSININVDSFANFYPENTPLSAAIRIHCGEDNYSSWQSISLNPLLAFHSEYRTNGSLGSCSPHYNRTSPLPLDNAPYDQVEFSVDQDGMYAFEARTFNNNTGTVIAIYENEFDPLDASANLILEQAEANVSTQNFAINLSSSNAYILVISPIGMINGNASIMLEADGPSFLNTTGFSFEGKELGPQGIVHPSDGTMYVANRVCPDVNGWRHYYYSDPNTIGDEDYLLFSVKDYEALSIQNNASYASSGGEPGTTTLTNPPADYISSNNLVVMNRHWNFDIPASIQPNTLTDIRFYYTQEDVDNLAAATGNPSLSSADLYFTKINDPNDLYDINPVNGHQGIPAAAHCADEGIWEYRPSTVSDSTTWTGSTHSGGFYAQLQIHSFSGGGGGVGSFRQISDADNDGFTTAEDCNDNNAMINPGQTEIQYNGIDDDCNPLTLDNDLDDDGFLLADDCDDNNPMINPAQAELAYNGIDDDCNSNTLDDDLDQDGFGIMDDCNDENPIINPSQSEVPYNGVDDDCNPASIDNDLDQDGFGIMDDCDDENPSINLNALEIIYNGLDDDCDPNTLDDDLDQDGFGIIDDCDDENANINPDAIEIPNNDIDEDCDDSDLISSIQNPNKIKINVYPNPFYDQLIVEQEGLQQAQIKLLSISGQVVFTGMLEAKIIINLDNLTAGLYQLLVVSEESVFSKKLIKF